MKHRKHRRGGLNSPSPAIRSTVDLTIGVTGLATAGAIGATIPGLGGMVVNQGVMPIAGLSLMGSAADFGQPRRKRRRK